VVVRLVFIRIRKHWIGSSRMGKMKERFHYAIANEINVFPISEMMDEMIVDMVAWFLERNEMEGLVLNVYLKQELDCWGTCEKVGASEYDIQVSVQQNIRDAIATLMHELVHVQQWVNNKWSGDGEDEAVARQYSLADKYWNGE